MKTRHLWGTLLLTLLLLPGCVKTDEYVPSPVANFEALWKIMDENYCFFSYKEVDWNEVHDRYRVQVSDTMNRYALFDVLANMLKELKDGHTNLVSPFDMSRYWGWYEDYPPNFYADIQKKYLGTTYKIAGGLRYTKLAEGKIGYVYYGSFSSGVGDTNLDEMFLHFRDCKGLIVDVRDNGGGSLEYADRIASRFMQERMLTGYIQHKTGKGHNDFSDPYPIHLSPASERVIWLRPTVVLTNRHCYSSANDFVQMMRMMPYVTILGDRTGGGSGLPFTSELPNGWSVRFSASPMLDANKQHTEFGIDPDVKVDLTPQDKEQGKDTLIESALELLQKKEPEKQSISATPLPPLQ